jgi:DNA-binding Lrp family transcriptional regulator
MQTLRRDGIVNCQLDLPPAAAGFGTQARLWITARPACVVEVGEALARHPEISFAALTTGPTNLVAALNCRDALGLSDYLTERLAPLEAITTMETAPIIRTVKRAGPLLL